MTDPDHVHGPFTIVAPDGRPLDVQYVECDVCHERWPKCQVQHHWTVELVDAEDHGRPLELRCETCGVAVAIPGSITSRGISVGHT